MEQEKGERDTEDDRTFVLGFLCSFTPSARGSLLVVGGARRGLRVCDIRRGVAHQRCLVAYKVHLCDGLFPFALGTLWVSRASSSLWCFLSFLCVLSHCFWVLVVVLASRQLGTR